VTEIGNIPAFEQTFQIPIAGWKPATAILIINDPQSRPIEWFGKGDGHPAILILA